MSSKLQSLRRRNLILFGLVVVLLGVYILRPETTSSAREESLSFAFPDFDRDAANRIELSKLSPLGTPGSKLILQRGSASQWQLESHFRYPLKMGAEGLLDSISAARIKSEVTGRADTFSKYAGHDGWTEVTVIDARGKTILAFGLGGSVFPTTFLRLGSGQDQRVVRAIHLSASAAPVESSRWIDTNLWPGLSATSLIRIDVEQPAEDQKLILVKRGETPADVETASPERDPEGKKVWWMEAPEAGDAITMDVRDLAREFTGMLINDVVAGALTAEEEATYGFDEPEIVATVWSKRNDKVSKHTMEIARKAGADAGWYVRRKGAAWVFEVPGAGAFQRMRQLPTDFLQKPEPVVEPEGGDTPKEGDAPADGAASEGGEAPGGGDAKKDEDKKDDDKKDDDKKDDDTKDDAKSDDAGK